jgi:hypothetical protein
MLRLLTDAEVIATYGDPSKYIMPDGTIRELWRAAVLDSFALPKPLPLAWGGTASRISCNKKLRPELERIFVKLAAIPEAWGTINDYGGCYSWRRNVNDRRKLSRHSWGIAVDLDVADNPNGSRGDVHPLVIQAFYDEGWLWGGWFTSTPDPMHFEKAAPRV